MFAQDFNPVAALAAVRCPRCTATGLLEIDEETYRATPIQDRHQPRYHVEPSVPAKCPACDLVGEYPGLAWGTE